MKIHKVPLLQQVNDGVGESLRFCNLSPDQTEHFFGLRSYVQKYGQMSDDVVLGEDHVEFDDWHVFVPFETMRIKCLCCPEDIQCESEHRHSRFTCCTSCIAPICTECEGTLRRRIPVLPPAALTNDMIYYAPTKLCELNATVMEMICASVCITSMICFTLEKKYRGQRSFDGQAHVNQYRMAARGNATSFPLPDFIFALCYIRHCRSVLYWDRRNARFPSTRVDYQLQIRQL